MIPVIAFVLRSGGDFQPEHVLRLWSQLLGAGGWRGHVVCFTDLMSGWGPADIELRPLLRGYPGWWSKLELCAPEHDGLGDILYIDLDTTIVGPIDELAGAGVLTMLQDFNRPLRMGSGVMYMTPEARKQVWEIWTGGEPKEHIRNFRRKGDQLFFETAWAGWIVETWQVLFPGQIVSFKEHVQPSGFIIPWGARLICFHGHPRPWEVTC